MITDNFCIFFDNAVAAASGTGAPVHVMPYVGRGEPVNITAVVTGANAAAVTLTLTLKESDDGTTFTDVATFKMAKPDKLPTAAAFALPYNTVGQKYVRLDYTLTGAPAGLTIWAGVTRDHFAPYVKGQYVDGRKVA